MRPTISVIISCCDIAELLPMTLDSILRQTYRNFELICVYCEASQDNTLAVLQDYAARDPRIKIIYKSRNSTQDSRNLAIEQSVGDYLFFLDPGDLHYEFYLEKMFNTIQNEQSDIVMCGSDEFDQATMQNVNFQRFRQVKITQHVTTYPRADVLPIIFNLAHNNAWAKIFKRSIIDQYQIRFQSLKFGNQIFFTQYYLLNCARITLLNEILVHHCLRVRHSFKTKKTSYCGHYQALEHLRVHIPDDLFPQLKDSYDNLYFKSAYNGIKKADYRQGKDIFRHARKALRHANLWATFSGLRWFRRCLKINNFTLLYWILHKKSK